MISDLENMGSPAPGTGRGGDSGLAYLGAGFLVASSPRRRPPGTLLQRVLSRIDAEPARVTTDLEGRITSINPAFSGLCGYSFDEVRGRKPGSFLQGEGTDPSQVDVIRQAVRSRSSCRAELLNYHKNGGRYRVEIAIRPLVDAAGTVVGFEAEERQTG